MSQTSRRDTLAMLRRLLRGILLFGLASTATALLLIGHDEDAWQIVPLVALAIAVVATLIIATRPAAAATRFFRAAMVLLMLTGATGSLLHYRANMAFKREMDPSLAGFALFSSVIRAQAPPALAPGNLVLLGLLGLACAFRLDPQSRSLAS
jgi:hypothetical protein